MKRSVYFQTILILFSCIQFSTVRALEKKPWTFLVYLAAANNLNEFVGRDLAEMMKVGSNKNINILVYLTIQKEGEEKVTRRLIIHEGSLEQTGPDMQMDSGDTKTLMDALNWAITDYPSDHIAVVLWDHGTGPLNRSRKPSFLRGICYDDDTNNYLTDRDCLAAFSWAKDELRGGKKFDIIACDACFMAGIEVAYAFSPCADYFVASQETIPGDGYEYARVLKKFKKRSMKPKKFARRMVEAYGDEYTYYDEFTLSALNLHKLNRLVENINDVSRLLLKALQDSNRNRVLGIIYKCASERKCPTFYNGIYIDLYRFYRNLRKKVKRMRLPKSDVKQLKKMLKRGKRHIKKCVIANERSKAYKKARGLSIYFPRSLYGIDPSYHALYWTEQTEWFPFINSL